jgi:single-strand DNA-binding protein
MSNDINSVTLVGRLTRDAELKYTNAGTAVSNFSMAVNESIKQKDGSYADTANFFEIQYWGKPAEGLNGYLTKGRQVALQGKLKQQMWTDNATGQNRSKVVITAFSIQLLAVSTKQATDNYKPDQYSSTPTRTQQRFDGFGSGANGFDPPAKGFKGPEHFDDDIPF